MKNGIIFTIFKILIESLNYVSLVELFKYVAKKLLSDPSDIQSVVSASRIGVDIFIIFKWIFII